LKQATWQDKAIYSFNVFWECTYYFFEWTKKTITTVLLTVNAERWLKEMI